MQVQKSSQSSGHGNAILAVARMIQFVAPPYVVFHSDPIDCKGKPDQMQLYTVHRMVSQILGV